MSHKALLPEKHNLISETKFQLKSFLLIVRRQFQNLFISPAKKFKRGTRLINEPVIAVSESELWNRDDNEENWILTAGKIENLRIAVKKLDGIEVEGGSIFSFWAHLGNPNTARGYVVGREIREGCIVPTIAGGLCQLSNALYDAALKAGFEIIERHRHTRVIKGSLAEQDRDATVKWNYVDFRFKARNSFRIEIEITADTLVVKFRGAEKKDAIQNGAEKFVTASKLNDCYSCGNFECFKHPGKTAIKKRRQVTTFILDEKWSEYDDYIKQLATNDDYFIVPYHPNDNPTRSDRYTWTIKNQTNVRAVPFAAMRRALYTRLNSRTKNNVFSLGLKLDRGMAAAIVKHIPVECTHIVIAQNLLPFVWEQGAFGGRTYDVLMTRLPMEKLHERLDMAVAQHPESKTLNDFRAPQSLIELENISLTKSRHIITPHHEIANIFNNKSILLQWNYPAAKNGTAHKGNKILFPASALGRKGAYEVRRLAQELNLIIVVTGKATEDAKFWQGVTVESAGANPFENIGLVVYPAYVEHRPRVLLKAIAMGLPVIASTASGLGQADNLTIIPTGDYNALKGAVSEKMNARVYIS